MKYVAVTGGVISGLGKGITTSSLARMFKARGVTVTPLKIDPYLNVDAGTMNPYQHGEVFVLDDGTEVDLDLGNYERFLGESLAGNHNITTGKVYRSVIEKERRGDYLGNTVQIIPHITGEVKRMIREVGETSGAEVCLIEVGGTVGDIESMPFLEALREMRQEVGRQEDMAFVHTTLIPVVGAVGEAKTKPTQHSVRELRALGIQPDMIIARSSQPISSDIKAKISLFCGVPTEAVISVPDMNCIYDIPLHLEKEGVGDFLMRRMGLTPRSSEWASWKSFVEHYHAAKGEVNVGIVGKYAELKDAYLSHSEALHHCQGSLGVKVILNWFDSEPISNPSQPLGHLEKMDAILVPGGYGKRGVEGKIRAIQLAREKGLPFLGICLGFQLAAVEVARHILSLADANSSEFDPATTHPVVDLQKEQGKVVDMGGTQRLGAQKVLLTEGSAIAALYGRTEILERHRHRYELNRDYLPQFEEKGFKATGFSPDGRVEALELHGHPYFIGVQYHPEFLSRPESPHPLYMGLLQAAVARLAVLNPDSSKSSGSTGGVAPGSP
jgi:CTP synthase